MSLDRLEEALQDLTKGELIFKKYPAMRIHAACVTDQEELKDVTEWGKNFVLEMSRLCVSSSQ